MKKNILFIALTATLGLSSCNFLDTEVYGSMDEGKLYYDEKTCMAGLTGVYDKLGAQGAYGYNLWGKIEAGTDLMVYYKTNPNISSICYNNYNNNNDVIEGTWKDLYEGINRANDYISLIESRSDQDCGGKKNKEMFLAEAKALRAIFYMNLVAGWGEVPLKTKPTADLKDMPIKKSPQADIYELITSDLIYAEKFCLSADELDAPGRISKTAVQGLLARNYMWQAGYPVYADTWEDALFWANEVRNSGLHFLHKDEGSVNGYRQVFINLAADKYDLKYRECMLEVEFYGNGVNDKSNESGRLGRNIGVPNSAATDPNVPFNYGYFDATKFLVKKYEDEDLRKWWNIADYKYEKQEDGTVKQIFKTDAQKLTTIDGKPGKWRTEYEVVRPWGRNGSAINFPILRYADVLLMIAESSVMVASAPTQEAVDALNEVRRRAHASEVSLDDFSDLESVMEFIRDERARELCFEGNRRMDLRRWGEDYFYNSIRQLSDQSNDPDTGKKIGYDLGTYKSVAGENLEKKHIYFPIPQAELSTNPTCGQNENW